MSSFACLASRITLLPIEKADRLELAAIAGTDFRAVVQKGLHADGDLIVYIPEQAILPDAIIEEMGLVSEDGRTMLAGGGINSDGSKRRDRVKALRLRGTLSQGLVYAHTEKLGELVEGEDYAEALGVVKYVPPVPTSLSGRVEHAPSLRSYIGIENIKNYPGVFVAGEEVVGCEKIHGSCSIFSLINGEFVISSKGLAGKQLSLLDERDKHGRYSNAYYRMADRCDIKEKLRALAMSYPGENITIFGETYGVQELMYGLSKGELDFRAFDVRIGERYLDYPEFEAVCVEMNLPTPVVLYRGPYDKDAVEAAATGPESVSGRQTHHREGLVLRSAPESYDSELGRRILKVISWKYLAKKKDEDPEFE